MSTDLSVNGVYLEVGDQRIRVRRLQARILELLIGRLGHCVRRSTIYDALYYADPDGGPSSNSVEVTISQIRALFRRNDLPLEIVTHHAIGWELRWRTQS